MNRQDFFDDIRRAPFKKALSAKQVSGTEAILDEWDRRKLTDLRWLAYMLATTYHETAHTMQPIAEYGKGKGRKYGVKGKHGQVAYGRGYVQLTWDYNYARADAELGLKGALVKNYELAMRPDIAAQIMFEGMIEGWFTSKKLSTYFSASKTDWSNARRIINGVDKADLIAGYGKAFYTALLAAGAATLPTEIVEADRRPPPDIPAQELPQMPVDAVLDDLGETDPIHMPKEPEMAQKTGTGSIIGLIVIVGLVGLFVYAKFFAGWI